MAEHIFKPGEHIPNPGIYRVTHYRHRLPHEVTITDSGTFPACKKCGDECGFVLLQAVRILQQDSDFGV